MLKTTEANGSSIVFEQHTDHLGKVHDVRYFAPAGFDTAAKLAVHASELLQQLANTEATEVLS